MADLQLALALAPGDAELAAALAAAEADAAEARADTLLVRRMQADRGTTQSVKAMPSKANGAAVPAQESVQGTAVGALKGSRAAPAAGEATPGNASGAPASAGDEYWRAASVGPGNQAHADAQLSRCAQAGGGTREGGSAAPCPPAGAPGIVEDAGACQAACAQEGMSRQGTRAEHPGADQPAAASDGNARMAGAQSKRASAGDAEEREAAAGPHHCRPQAGQGQTNAGGRGAAAAAAGSAAAAQQPARQPVEAAELAGPRRVEQLVQRLRVAAGSHTAL